MKAKEVTDILIALGWRANTDEVGGKSTRLYLADPLGCTTLAKDKKSLHMQAALNLC